MTLGGALIVLGGAILAISFLVFVARWAFLTDFIESVMAGVATFLALSGAVIGLIAIILLVTWIGTATGAFG